MFADRGPNNQHSPDNSPEEARFGGQSSEYALAYNPLNRQILDTIRFRDGELAGLTATVNQIASTKLVVGTEPFVFTDYDLSAPQTEGTKELADEDGVVRIRLRCLAGEHGELDTVAFQAQRFDAKADWMFDNHKSQQGTVSLRDYAGNFQHGFSRIDQVQTPYHGERTVLGDPRLPDAGIATVTQHKIDYLDYERNTRDSSGEEYTQYALVEYNQRTQDMITLFGWSIDPRSIA